MFKIPEISVHWARISVHFPTKMEIHHCGGKVNSRTSAHFPTKTSVHRAGISVDFPTK